MVRNVFLQIKKSCPCVLSYLICLTLGIEESLHGILRATADRPKDATHDLLLRVQWSQTETKILVSAHVTLELQKKWQFRKRRETMQ